MQRKLGQLDKARLLYERALAIEEKAYGPNHPDVATVLTNLGITWTYLGQPDKARLLLERALVSRNPSRFT